MTLIMHCSDMSARSNPAEPAHQSLDARSGGVYQGFTGLQMPPVIAFHLLANCLCVARVIMKECTDPVQLLRRQRRAHILCDILQRLVRLVISHDEGHCLSNVFQFIP